ncbi:2og-fe oxygenase [Lasallia pustulata]|uniref:2og-fe oxygenase n=1 Tax=Lasallia pustulata TaxID=136370 RepID=A0A1W5CZC8_9LECA|nr:2og-fe oxygenase [Lasallia pustulata]
MSFTSIPILDLSLSRNPETKPAFLDSLRHALLEVGFFYISNTGIDESLIDAVITQAKAFFALPLEKKLEIEMKNVPSFLGAPPTHRPPHPPPPPHPHPHR